MTLVIGLGGRKTAGKDVVADYLVDKYGFVKLGMSDVLAEALYALNPLIPLPFTITKRNFWGRKVSKKEMAYLRYQEIVDTVGYVHAKEVSEIRGLLQRLGTEVGRDILGQDIWVDIVRSRIDELTRKHGKNVVLTGVRYQNEITMIYDLNNDSTRAAAHSRTSVPVWVERPGLEAGDTHSSENSLKPDEFEYVLLNDGSIEELTYKVDELLQTIQDDYFGPAQQ